MIARARLASNPNLILVLALGLAALVACADEGERDPRPDADASPPDGGAKADDAGMTHDGGAPHDAGRGGDGGEPPTADAGPPPFGGLVPDTSPEAQEVDLFGVPGHRVWLEVSEAQLERMNLAQGGGGVIFDGLGRAVAQGDPLYLALERDGFALPFPGSEGDIYTPGGMATYADHFVLQDAVSGSVADYGKVEAALVGESTGRTFDALHIPNVRIDADEFVKDQRIGGFEHFRFNNGLVGSIFREAIAHRVYRALGYPALRATWAFLGSNVWGDDVWVPMTLIEAYKRRFCKDNAELLGGGCENMWEFPGSVGDGFGGAVPDSACQVSECDHSRLETLIEAVAAAPAGPGIKPALSDLLDWERFHQFQCLSFMLWTGDDPIHNGNNNLIIERDDGRLIWAPYSIDISAGQEWYRHVPLPGTSPIATRCQADPTCWADTVATCEALIEKFDALDPEKLVDEAVETLTELGMMRDGDERRAEELRAWYVERQQALPEELERFRYLPDEYGNCPGDLQLCGDGGCGTLEQCAERLCTLGQSYCDSMQRCVDPAYEPCPTCPQATPLRCHLNDRCVATHEDCWASCGAIPGQVYCPAFDSCTHEDLCPSDEDGGVVLPPIEI